MIRGMCQPAPDRPSYTMVLPLKCWGAICTHTVDLMIDSLQLRGPISNTAKISAKARQGHPICIFLSKAGLSVYLQFSYRDHVPFKVGNFTYLPLLPRFRNNTVFHTTAVLGNALGKKEQRQ
ncbi:hypothetical protein BDW66DRAFT_143766 [Aspergillus desertorum]